MSARRRVRLLKSPFPVAQHQRVAHAVLSLPPDRGRLVNHARVIHHKYRPGLLQGEAHAGGAARIDPARLATEVVALWDENHRHEIHSIAMRALGRRTADARGGVDAELVRLDEPARHGSKLPEQLAHGS